MEGGAARGHDRPEPKAEGASRRAADKRAPIRLSTVWYQAVSPSAEDHRPLVDWLVTQAVPAAWEGRLPARAYTIDGFKPI